MADVIASDLRDVDWAELVAGLNRYARSTTSWPPTAT